MTTRAFCARCGSPLLGCGSPLLGWGSPLGCGPALGCGSPLGCGPAGHGDGLDFARSNALRVLAFVASSYAGLNGVYNFVRHGGIIRQHPPGFFDRNLVGAIRVARYIIRHIFHQKHSFY